MARDARRAWARTLVGRTVADRYRIDRLIDVGGMGAVFEGVHLEVQRAVAIKTVVPGALDDVQAERLRREARQAAAVGGRGVVGVMDFGVDEVCGPFLVMELLSGETLAARMSRAGAFSVDESLRVAAEVLDTLAAVHARGLVHRDLKPDNLFFAREDGAEVVKILDFGIARRAVSEDDTLTETGAILGTPRYMAPEQARGEGTVDPRVDVYAMGAILYAMLSGRRPYEELDRNAVMQAAAAGPPRPLAELAPRLAPSVIAVVERAMAFDAELRYPDAGAMRAALHAALGTAGDADADDTGTLTSSPLERAVAPGASVEARGTIRGSEEPDRSARDRRRASRAWIALAGVAVVVAVAALAWREWSPLEEPLDANVAAPAPSGSPIATPAQVSPAPAEPAAPLAGSDPLAAPDPVSTPDPNAADRIVTEHPTAAPDPIAPPAPIERRAVRSVPHAEKRIAEPPPRAEPVPPARDVARARSGSLRMEDF